MVFMDGFPHSDIGGSQNICFSPPLFAAYHVLLRLPVPRHPPCALFCLTISTYSVMSDGLFNLSIALVCFCYSLKNNRFDVLIFHQFIFSMQFSRNIFRRCMIYNLLRWIYSKATVLEIRHIWGTQMNAFRLFWLSEQSSHSKTFFTIWLLFRFFINLAATYLPIPLPV